MTVGITQIAHSLRQNSADSRTPIPLSRGQELVCAALGHKTFASFQAAQKLEREPQFLDDAPHVVLDYELLAERAVELKDDTDPEKLRSLMRNAFKERMPRTQVHSSYSALAGEFLEAVQQTVINDDEVNNAMANANYDGIDEVYVEDELEPEKATLDEAHVESVSVQVSLGIDIERPYSGHQVRCYADVTSIRLGRRFFERPEIEVNGAGLVMDWGDSEEYDEEPYPLTLAEAFASKLRITKSEAEELVDAEAIELTGSSGESFSGYEFDFTDHANPKLAAKLMDMHGTLTLRVGPYFFENIQSTGT